jgi:phage baseplate assembly protein W
MPTPVAIPNAPYWQPKAGRPGETVSGLEEIAQSISTIFLTQVGTAPLMPRFGFDALSAMGRPMRDAKRLLERKAIEAFYWEPRAKVEAVRASYVTDTNVLLLLVWKPVGGDSAVAQAVIL